LISAPNGKTFFVRVGDLIGLRSGKITQIRSDAVTIVETEEVKGKRVSGAVELRIGGEMVSLSGRKGED
jgi:Tfp pilus assembly protein PilP